MAAQEKIGATNLTMPRALPTPCRRFTFMLLGILASATSPCWQPAMSSPSQHDNAMRVKAVGGLTSRLRVVLSYLAVARQNCSRLVVHWASDNACPAMFSELFEPIGPDINVTDEPAEPHILLRTFSLGGLRIRAPASPTPELGAMALALLHPVPSLLKQIDRLRRELGIRFAAVHIRRTDKSSDYASDAGFAEWARAWARNQQRVGVRGARVYVLTDNPRSLATVRKALPSHAAVAQRGIFDAPPGGDETMRSYKAAAAPPLAASDVRLTSVGAAVIDMWVASHAAEFKGTRQSSFSAMIESLRRARGLQHCDVAACVWC
jgi:hypothetical protein